MTELIHKILLCIHIPAGLVALVLFWIPVGVKKGSPLHRKVGKIYFKMMWIVLVTAFLMSVCNIIMEKYAAAIFLGYLSIITAYPLWYSFEILHQEKVWTNRYFMIRKAFSLTLFLSGLGLVLLGTIQFHFAGMGTVMVFFGALGIPAVRDVFMTSARAMDKETKMKMHIQGTIISGIAAYTAFLAFGGSRIMVEILHVHHQWMVVPWILPTLLGFAYSAYMRRKYRVV